jgi:2-keto-4-pentenoate hydratase/2-oxohepta-3-ene-1,7-dioic acid hydratase in catechol pathway
MMRAWVVVVTCSAMSGYILLHLHTCRDRQTYRSITMSMTRKKGSKGSVPIRGWMDGRESKRMQQDEKQSQPAMEEGVQIRAGNHIYIYIYIYIHMFIRRQI